MEEKTGCKDMGGEKGNKINFFLKKERQVNVLNINSLNFLPRAVAF